MVYTKKMETASEEFFRDRLRFLRNERAISAREMSLALGQNETYINKIETGQRSVSMDAFFRICDFLNVSPAAFFPLKYRIQILQILKLFLCLENFLNLK